MRPGLPRRNDALRRSVFDRDLSTGPHLGFLDELRIRRVLRHCARSLCRMLARHLQVLGQLRLRVHRSGPLGHGPCCNLRHRKHLPRGRKWMGVRVECQVRPQPKSLKPAQGRSRLRASCPASHLPVLFPNGSDRRRSARHRRRISPSLKVERPSTPKEMTCCSSEVAPFAFTCPPFEGQGIGISSPLKKN